MDKEIIVLLVVGILAIIATATTVMCNYAREKDFIYIHLNTGNRYRVIQECLMKIDGTWKNAIVYVSEEEGEMYVRESKDFRLNFKRLSEWKKD